MGTKLNICVAVSVVFVAAWFVGPYALMTIAAIREFSRELQFAKQFFDDIENDQIKVDHCLKTCLKETTMTNSLYKRLNQTTNTSDYFLPFVSMHYVVKMMADGLDYVRRVFLFGKTYWLIVLALWLFPFVVVFLIAMCLPKELPSIDRKQLINEILDSDEFEKKLDERLCVPTE